MRSNVLFVGILYGYERVWLGSETQESGLRNMPVQRSYISGRTGSLGISAVSSCDEGAGYLSVKGRVAPFTVGPGPRTVIESRPITVSWIPIKLLIGNVRNRQKSQGQLSTLRYCWNS